MVPFVAMSAAPRLALGSVDERHRLCSQGRVVAASIPVSPRAETVITSEVLYQLSYVGAGTDASAVASSTDLLECEAT
jgi:hypothetical protein